VTGGWRVEADDEWLATHSSDTFQRLRRRARLFAGLGEAMSNAELGPFGGTPRRPVLKIGGRAYSFVRYADHHLTYTTIQVEPDTCRHCGRELAERHRVEYVRGDTRESVAVVRMCRACHAGAWLFHSHMPSTARARRAARKVVL
jgi:hypothetical protein